MSVTHRPLFAFDNTFVRDLVGLFEPWQAATVPDPQLLVLNEALAHELAVDPAALRSPEGVAVLAGNVVPEGAAPVAQAYAGHQFGGLSPRLGDGRALLLGEVLDAAGQRRDVHLKGSGRTPFARGGDGKAAVGPMLREYVIGEAMHALGIPTTRALAVVSTGERIARDTWLPGAVLTRVAASHLRVGTFQYAAMREDTTLVQRLADHAIARHHPAAASADNPYLALLDSVIDAQASLISRWMLVGFIHGVMNTDNMTISGETIDYGPCAFMDAYDPATVFSSIDHGGRYAYGNQPAIGQWNLARLAEALLPLISSDMEQAIALATERLHGYTDRYRDAFTSGMLAKLGLAAAGTSRDRGEGAGAEDERLIEDLLALLRTSGVDFTGFFRALAVGARGDLEPARRLFLDIVAFDEWATRWTTRWSSGGRSGEAVADAMDAVNPLYIPRNHRVEEALAAGTEGDLAPFEQLLDAVTRPFEERPGLERYAEPAPGGGVPYQTFCGT